MTIETWQLVLAFIANLGIVGGLSAYLTARVQSRPDAMQKGTEALVQIIDTLRLELTATTDRLEAERLGRASDDRYHGDLRQTLQRMTAALLEAEALIAEWETGSPSDMPGWQERAARWLNAHRETKERSAKTSRRVNRD